ncbi:MAG: large conductance mechanosensitive channel protein MscL [Clostridia bacterium]|nr:large conductance mechanosensitive channel protein MscL [Clostridia bacterium]
MSKKGSFWADFKAFITRGNVIDLAVAVVIGGAFGKIVTGLVNYIINPFVGVFVKGGSLDALKTVLTPAVVEDGVVTTEEVAILWGAWIQTIVDFIIVALCIFAVLRVLMKAKEIVKAKEIAEAEEKAKADKAKADEEKAALEAKTKALEDAQLETAKLLGEIKTLLEKQSK